MSPQRRIKANRREFYLFKFFLDAQILDPTSWPVKLPASHYNETAANLHYQSCILLHLPNGLQYMKKGFSYNYCTLSYSREKKSRTVVTAVSLQYLDRSLRQVVRVA